MEPCFAPPDIYTDGVGKIADVAIWQDGRHFPTKMRWGLRPSRPDGHVISLLRAEGRTFARRCLIVVNKLDLLPHLEFDLARLLANIDAVNPAAQVISTSARSGEGIDEWRRWLASVPERAAAAV